MARIRTLKPGFWTDPELVGIPFEARLFFIGTWTFADDYGVLKDEPARLRMQIMPADPVDAAAIVDLLVEHNLLLRRVAADGTRVLVIRTFCDHQKIDLRKKGRWGHPDEFTAPDGPTPRPVAPIRADEPENADTGTPVLDWTGRDPSPQPPKPIAIERVNAILKGAVELAFAKAKDSRDPPRHPMKWKAWKAEQLREEQSERLQDLLGTFGRAPDSVLAAALLGDTHSLSPYREAV